MNASSSDSSSDSSALWETREEWLREEVKNHRALLLSLIQWGVTLLAAVESSLYFVRRDLAQSIMQKQYVIPAQVLTFGRWLYGTIFLIVISALFSLMTSNLLKRYYDYRDQLITVAAGHSGIHDGRVKRAFGWVTQLFFWAFPILDVGLWVIFHN